MSGPTAVPEPERPIAAPRGRPGRLVLPALSLDGEGDDALLRAVVAHYHERLMDDRRHEERLTAFGVSSATALRLRLGLCDRTLGLRLPDRKRVAGAAARNALCRLGVLRESGHEPLRGCLVVPVIAPTGEVLGLYGLRSLRKAADWAACSGGGIFNRPAAWPERAVVTTTIAEALGLVEAGVAVVAPGRPGGFNEEDLRALAGSGTELVCSGDGAETLADELCDLGAAVSLAPPGAVLVPERDAARHRSPASRARLAEAATAPATLGTRPATDELYLQKNGRSWRLRGVVGSASRPDSLRVVVSVADAATGRFHLDTVDLYLARSRKAFLESAADELHAERELLALELAEVVAAAEAARDRASAGPEVPEASEAERSEATEWLSAPGLLDRLVSDLGALGVVGEQTNLLCCYLAAVSRLCERPFGVVVQSSPAAGKSTLVDAVCALVPEEDLVSLSSLTEKALYYLRAGSLSHKVLSLAEEDGAARAAYALKLLLSEGRLSTAAAGKDRASGRMRTTAYETAGPVALLMTTTRSEVDPELESRLVTLGVDEGAVQTAAVVAAQRDAVGLSGLAARVARDELRRRHRSAQRLLRPYPVVLPDLRYEFPTTSTRHRRDHQKALSLVAAVAVLHQHQRQVKTLQAGGRSVAFVEAAGEDVEVGMALATELLGRGADALSPPAQRLLAAVEAHAAERGGGGEGPCDVAVTRRELRERLGWSDRQVRRATDRLVELEHLVVSGGGRGKLRTYSLAPGFAPVRPSEGRTSPGPLPGTGHGFARVARFPEDLDGNAHGVVGDDGRAGSEAAR